MRDPGPVGKPNRARYFCSFDDFERRNHTRCISNDEILKWDHFKQSGKHVSFIAVILTQMHTRYFLNDHAKQIPVTLITK